MLERLISLSILGGVGFFGMLPGRALVAGAIVRVPGFVGESRAFERLF